VFTVDVHPSRCIYPRPRFGQSFIYPKPDTEVPVNRRIEQLGQLGRTRENHYLIWTDYRSGSTSNHIGVHRTRGHLAEATQSCTCFLMCCDTGIKTNQAFEDMPVVGTTVLGPFEQGEGTKAQPGTLPGHRCSRGSWSRGGRSKFLGSVCRFCDRDCNFSICIQLDRVQWRGKKKG
jgi:hypothetical protein